ncbi:hypothetical protein JCM11251_001316 [Rhodosporidiobolus azoricus]
MADLNLPPHSFFAAPEGVYTLVSSLNVPTATSANSSTANFTPLPGAPQAAPAAGQGGQPGPEQPAAPPAYSSKLAVVSVRFPVKEGGGGGGAGLGLGMSMGRSAKGKETADSTPAIAAPIPGASDTSASDGASTAGGSGGDRSAGGGNGPPGSPAVKRRPLASSFSMLGSFYGSEGAGVATTRPARGFKGSSSSFVRSWEGLPLSQMQLRTIAESNAGKETIFGFQTMGKAVVWTEIAQGKKDALSRIIFASFPTCIDANQHTASNTQVDVLIGFATGDILWMDPLTARYSRFNKSGIITNSPVTSILWLPPAPPSGGPSSSPSQMPSSPSGAVDTRSNLFLTSHADGTMLIWDKDREDWNGFVPTSAPYGESNGKENEWSLGGATMGAGKVQEGNEDMVVSRPAATDKKGQSTSKFNPVSHWKLSRKAITAFAFSPDLQLCAAVGEDGCLRIIDAVEEKLLDTYSSYFGALNCVSFSPDGRFVVTGGQDDLCTVYAPLEQHVVAHCQGHSSWVSSVAWDPWRSEDRTMRFVSVGDDCKLILWDLSSAALTRPKAHAHPHARRHSASSHLSLPRRSHYETAPLSPPDFSSPPGPIERTGPSFHPAPRRDDVSLLQPVLVKTLSNDLFTGIKILPEYVITSSRTGQVKQFDRPPVTEGLLGGLSNEFAASVVRIDARAR